jgi:hypothetical protein
MGTGELVLSTKISGREKLELLAGKTKTVCAHTEKSSFTALKRILSRDIHRL